VPDLDAVLLNVEERNKWRQRLATLESQRQELQRRRDRLQDRLRHLRRELARAEQLARSVAEARARILPPSPSNEVRPSTFGVR
jgi:chromosome segregation ATPase